MKIEPKFYRVRVDGDRSSAVLVCVTYNLDTGKRLVGIEYYELVWSFEDENLSIPSSRQATYKEELRVLHQAASAYEGPRAYEKEHIESHLKVAYGSDVNVCLEDIEPKQ